MREHLYHYRVRRFPKVFDGDSCWAEIDLGFHVTATVPCRLEGINAPEMGTGEGEEARDYLRGFLIEGLKVDTDAEIIIRSHRRDKYGRWLVTIFINGNSINDIMLDDGFAEVYS